MHLLVIDEMKVDIMTENIVGEGIGAIAEVGVGVDLVVTVVGVIEGTEEKGIDEIETVIGIVVAGDAEVVEDPGGLHVIAEAGV